MNKASSSAARGMRRRLAHGMAPSDRGVIAAYRCATCSANCSRAPGSAVAITNPSESCFSASSKENEESVRSKESIVQSLENPCLFCTKANTDDTESSICNMSSADMIGRMPASFAASRNSWTPYRFSRSEMANAPTFHREAMSTIAPGL